MNNEKHKTMKQMRLNDVMLRLVKVFSHICKGTLNLQYLAKKNIENVLCCLKKLFITDISYHRDQ